MLTLSNVGLKKLKINFEYKTERITLSAEPYKTIKEMKAKALSHIFPTPSAVHLFYLNREITAYENEQVGTYFSGKSAIILKMTSSDSTIESSAPMQSNCKSVYTDIKEGLFSTTQPPKSPEHLLNGFEYTCMCRTDTVMYYCRSCRVFLCHNCRMNKKHKAHLTIHVDTQNLEESIRLYAMIVQTDIETNIQSSQDFYTKFKSNAYLDSGSKREVIVNKLEELTRRYNELIALIDKSTSKSNEVPLVISEFHLNSKIINGEVDNILNEVYGLYSKAKRRISYEQFQAYFNLINSKEKEWEGMTREVIKYKISSEINAKMNRMYDKINSAIDELLNDTSPFLLEEKSLSALTEMKQENEERGYKEIAQSNTVNQSNQSALKLNAHFNRMIQPTDDNNEELVQPAQHDLLDKHEQEVEHDYKRKKEALLLQEKTKKQMKKKKDSEEREINEIHNINTHIDKSSADDTKEQDKKFIAGKPQIEQPIQKPKEKEPVPFEEFEAPKKSKKRGRK